MNPPGPLRSDGMPDMRYSSNRAWASNMGTCIPLTTGGTYSSSSWNSTLQLRNETLAANAPARLRKDNMPDMRYRENKDFVKKVGMQVETASKKTSSKQQADSTSTSKMMSSGQLSATGASGSANYSNFNLVLPDYLSPSSAKSAAAEREELEKEGLLMKLLQRDRDIADLKKANAKLQDKADEAKSAVKEARELCTSLEKLQLDDVEELSGEVLRTVTSDFKNRIAQGGFSDVYKGIWRKREVAVKVLRLGDREDLHRSLNYLNREVNTLALLDHRHIVKLLAVCKSSNPRKPSPALIFTYANCGTLFEALFCKESKVDLSAKTMVRISLHIASAIKYLHSCRQNGKVLVHRDVKSANVLLSTKTGHIEALLADLGIARFTRSLAEENEVQSSVTEVVGTKGYIDPVYAETYRVDPSMDVYAYGVVLLEMLWRERPDNPLLPVARHARMMSLEQCVEKAAAKNPSTSTDTLEMIRGLVSIAKLCVRTDDVKERPTARDIVRKLLVLE